MGSGMSNHAGEIYDRIGPGYVNHRRPDQYWIQQLHRHFQDLTTLVNIGAGTGSYEPASLAVVAVEPSPTMIKQRPENAAPVVCGIAEQLPFRNTAFDVAMAVLTVHHWFDAVRGLAEMRRVSHKQIIVTWDPIVFAKNFWLVRDYLPEIAERESTLTTLHQIAAEFQSPAVHILPVPSTCSDGFLGAFWCRPQAYLDHKVRGATSAFALLDTSTVNTTMQRLQDDLASGLWRHNNSDILDRTDIDLGYRLLVAEQ